MGTALLLLVAVSRANGRCFSATCVQGVCVTANVTAMVVWAGCSKKVRAQENSRRGPRAATVARHDSNLWRSTSTPIMDMSANQVSVDLPYAILRCRTAMVLPNKELQERRINCPRIPPADRSRHADKYNLMSATPPSSEVRPASAPDGRDRRRLRPCAVQPHDQPRHLPCRQPIRTRGPGRRPGPHVICPPGTHERLAVARRGGGAVRCTNIDSLVCWVDRPRTTATDRSNYVGRTSCRQI